MQASRCRAHASSRGPGSEVLEGSPSGTQPPTPRSWEETVFPAPLRPFSLGKSVCLVSLGPFTPLV